MNGTHAGGVHGPVETTLTTDGAAPPVAFEAFFEKERVRLLRALYLLTGNREEAEEVLQECYLNIWNHASGYSVGLSAPMTWMRGFFDFR